jgi:hypothetical protein
LVANFERQVSRFLIGSMPRFGRTVEEPPGLKGNVSVTFGAANFFLGPKEFQSDD